MKGNKLIKVLRKPDDCRYILHVSSDILVGFCISITHPTLWNVMKAMLKRAPLLPVCSLLVMLFNVEPCCLVVLHFFHNLSSPRFLRMTLGLLLPSCVHRTAALGKCAW